VKTGFRDIQILVGYGARRANAEAILLLILPLVISISFFLIADIDSPRRGIIRVHPQNLLSLAQSLRQSRPAFMAGIATEPFRVSAPGAERFDSCKVSWAWIAPLTGATYARAHPNNEGDLKRVHT
jgi:hypothetical protein